MCVSVFCHLLPIEYGRGWMSAQEKYFGVIGERKGWWSAFPRNKSAAARIRGEKWFAWIFTPARRGAAPTKIRSLIAEPDFNPPGQSNDVSNPSIARPLFIQPLKPDAHFNFYRGVSRFFRRFIASHQTGHSFFETNPFENRCEMQMRILIMSRRDCPPAWERLPRKTTNDSKLLCPPISIFNAHIGSAWGGNRLKNSLVTLLLEFDGKILELTINQDEFRKFS